MASTANGLVVVTGGAGALGRAVLAEFRKGGAEVVALDLPGHPLDEVGREPGVHPVAGELSSPEQVRAAWAQIDRIGGPPGRGWPAAAPRRRWSRGRAPPGPVRSPI